MDGHNKIVCSCGAIIAQCRCFAHEKRVEFRQDGCANCIARKRTDLSKPPIRG